MSYSSFYLRRQEPVLQSTICKFLHNQGFTRQKLTQIAVQRSDDIRISFPINISLFKKEMFVFVDETGSDRSDCLRKYGYSMTGKPPISLQLYSRGLHITAIAASVVVVCWLPV